VNNTMGRITADKTSGPAPLTVNFSSTGSADNAGNPLSYLWNFDDGSNSTAANPSHTFASPGFYNAKLTVTGHLGSQTASVVIEAKQDPWTLDLNNGWNGSGLVATEWTVIDPAKGSVTIAGDGSLTLNTTTAPFGIQSVRAYDLPYCVEAEFKNNMGGPGDGFELAGSRIGWDSYFAWSAPATIKNLGNAEITNIGQTIESAQSGPERLTLKVYVTADPNHAGKARYKGYLTAQMANYYFEFENQVYAPGNIKITDTSINQNLYRFQVWKPGSAFTFGDANGDGAFTLADLNTLVDWLLMRSPPPASGTATFTAADVNGDGKIDMTDLNLYVDRLLSRITKFPVEP
jgi:PKD repeat protein